MASNAAEQHPEINSGGDRLFGPNRDGGEAYVVGVLQDPEAPAAVKGDVELARQPVELAVVQDVMVELASVGAGIDQLLRIDTCGGAAGQVANVVGPGTARGQPQLVDRGQHRDRVPGADLADLQIRASSDVQIAAAISFGDRAQAS